MSNWIPDMFGVDTARIAAKTAAEQKSPLCQHCGGKNPLCTNCNGEGITYERPYPFTYEIPYLIPSEIKNGSKTASSDVPCEICGGMGITYEGHPCPQGCRNSLAQSITGDISAMNAEQGQLADKAKAITNPGLHNLLAQGGEHRPDAHRAIADIHAEKALKLSQEADRFGHDEYNILEPKYAKEAATELHEAAAAHALAALTHREAAQNPGFVQKAADHSNHANSLSDSLDHDYDEQIAIARDAMDLQDTERRLQNWGRL